MSEKAIIDSPVWHDVSLLTAHDVYLFKQGNHYRLYNKLGSHLCNRQGEIGVLFAVWAPNATSVAVMGDFNDWDSSGCPLRLRDDGSGMWEGFIGGLGNGAVYKYHHCCPVNRERKGSELN